MEKIPLTLIVQIMAKPKKKYYASLAGAHHIKSNCRFIYTSKNSPSKLIIKEIFVQIITSVLN